MSDRKFIVPALAPLYVPPGGPPRVEPPSREIYARMGEANIYRMCEDFYAEIGKSPVRILFPDDLPAASRKIALFLIGLFGGPPLYREQFGEPRMRARHLAFPINEEARQHWLGCFLRTLEGAEAKYAFPAEHLPGFRTWLTEFSAWMVNRR